MGILNFYLIELLAESKSGELFYINLMELFSEYFAQWIRDIKFPLITVLIVNLCAVFIGGIFSSKHNSKRNLPSVSVATILSCLDQAVIFLDQQKKIKYINPGFAELSGYKSGELEGRKLEAIFSKTCDSFQNKKLKEIDIKKRKETLLTKEKRKIEVRYSVAPVLEQGEVKGILCTFIKNKNQKTEGGNSVQKNQEVLAEIKEKLSREKQKRKNLQNRLKQKDKKIEQVVSKDQLTGLLNRQGFCQSVKRRLEKI
ncbi:MAG: PAS domain S-box protein, partial [bacterium]